jgi:hypothetical protein
MTLPELLQLIRPCRNVDNDRSREARKGANVPLHQNNRRSARQWLSRGRIARRSA